MTNAVIEAMNAMELAEDEQKYRDDPALWARVLQQADGHPLFVLPDISNPALVCGFVTDGDVGEVWMLRGAGFKGRVVGKILRQQKALCRMVYQSFSLTEMRLAVWPEFDAGKRWAERLGFVFDRVVSSAEHEGKDVEIWLYQYYEEESNNGFS